MINSIIQMILRELSSYEKPKSYTDLYLSMSIKLTIVRLIIK